jgi:hypothetical protein
VHETLPHGCSINSGRHHVMRRAIVARPHSKNSKQARHKHALKCTACAYAVNYKRNCLPPLVFELRLILFILRFGLAKRPALKLLSAIKILRARPQPAH